MNNDKFTWHLILEHNHTSIKDMATYSEISSDCLYSWIKRRTKPSLEKALLFKKDFNAHFGLDLTVEEMWGSYEE